MSNVCNHFGTARLDLRKGEEYVNKFMAEHALLIEAKAKGQSIVGDILKFKEQFRGIAGEEWPDSKSNI